MNDSALQAIYRELATAQGPLWWFVDEHLQLPLPAARADCQSWSNRADSAQALQNAGFQVQLNDFEITAGAAPQTVLYRVSKEKLLVHYLINTALEHLAPGGRLLLAGKKSDGLKTYASKAAKLVAGKAQIRKLGSEAYLAVIEKCAEPSASLPDGNYRELQCIQPSPELWSKPGVFGWQKIDRGSALLIAQLPAVLADGSHPPTSLLDLGCGYGYLAVMAARLLPDTAMILTDNSATALVAAQRNIDCHGLDARCVLADCAEGIAERVDLLLCNPPFHHGFAVEGALTDRFLRAASQRLSSTGRAVFVVNQFIPLARKAQGLFSRCELVAEAEGFKVFVLQR